MGRRFGFTRSFVAATCFVALLVAGCKDDPKAKTESSGPKTPEKIPEDFVMNDFFKEGKSFKPAFPADAGMDASFLPTAAASGSAPAGTLEEPAVADRKMNVVNAGADPKVARRYALKGGTEERRLLVTASVTQEAQGQRSAGDQPPISAALSFTGKNVGGEPRLEVVLKKMALTMPPQTDKKTLAAQEATLKELSGMTISLRMTPRGSLGDPEFAQDKMPRGAQEVLPILAQAFEIVTVPFPEEPIGVGAVWEERQMQKEQGGLEVASHMTYTLKEVKGDVLKIDVEIKRESKKVEIKAQRVPPGTTMQLNGTGRYSYETKLSAVATKVEGDLVTIRALEVPANGPNAQKVKQVETAKVKHVIDTGRVP